MTAAIATVTATVNEPSVRVTAPLPELPNLGVCDCGRDLVCLLDSSTAVFCERCDLGIAPAGRR
ncbi:hypothetical protein GCM10010250_21680 [Streptomyces althioticus]|uniref:hypothetical protein n=1 Tax=Streptomyces althioticus TaxID=83380 RepID=UPI00187584DA|nr:hypothetical protein GCM10010250_21680 [Streptomyces althioticus]